MPVCYSNVVIDTVLDAVCKRLLSDAKSSILTLNAAAFYGFFFSVT